MIELWTLTLRHLRTTLRSRLARVTLLLFLCMLGAVAFLGAGAGQEGSVFLLFALLLLLLLVAGVVTSAGAVLPEDRSAGREDWLSTLAPAAWKRRLSPVLAAWLLALAVGAGGGLLIGTLAALAGPKARLTTYQSLPLPERALIGRGGQAFELTLPASTTARRTLEIEVRTSLADRVLLGWESGGRSGEREIAARGPVRIELPAGGRLVRLTCRSGHLRLRLVAARLLGASRSILPVLGLTGLLLGLMAGAIAPLAVLFSRFTSAQTATAAAVCLLLVGVARHGLLTLAADLEPEGLRRLAPLILSVCSRLVPDIPVLELLSEVLAGLVPAAGLLHWLGPALLYTALAALLVCLPAPRRFTEGMNP